MNKAIISLFCFFLGLSVTGQGISISGVVTSAEDGEPLIGATVKVKGASTGVTTDIDGNYFINVKNGAVLQFSYVGYESAEETVKSAAPINVTLKQQSNMLDELVVIGYGSVKKATLLVR